jgi:metal-dependent hydrolase (beta-lactamase superfamily II)
MYHWEIPRKADFWAGWLTTEFTVTELKSDPLIRDKRALIFNLKNKGLTMVSGCTHLGIINIIRYT